MARRRPSGPEYETAERETASATRREDGAARAEPEQERTRRGAGARSAAQDQGEAEEGGGDETVRRAEELIDRVADRVGQFTSYLGRQVLRLGARAREEAEDMWAEAQSIRRGRQP
jgi:hypothetical protein